MYIFTGISAPDNRIELAWVGGSILSTFSAFKNMSISRAQYLEYGEQIFHRKKASDGISAGKAML